MLFSSVFSITKRRDIGLYEVSLPVSFFGLWDRNYVSQLPCVRYYVFVKNSLKHNREECECLIFSLSGPCEFLFLLCFIASWT